MGLWGGGGLITMTTLAKEGKSEHTRRMEKPVKWNGRKREKGGKAELRMLERHFGSPTLVPALRRHLWVPSAQDKGGPFSSPRHPVYDKSRNSHASFWWKGCTGDYQPFVNLNVWSQSSSLPHWTIRPPLLQNSGSKGESGQPAASWHSATCGAIGRRALTWVTDALADWLQLRAALLCKSGAFHHHKISSQKWQVHKDQSTLEGIIEHIGTFD